MLKFMSALMEQEKNTAKNRRKKKQLMAKRIKEHVEPVWKLELWWKSEVRKKQTDFKTFKKEKKDEITFFFYKICSIFYALERKYHR